MNGDEKRWGESGSVGRVLSQAGVQLGELRQTDGAEDEIEAAAGWLDGLLAEELGRKSSDVGREGGEVMGRRPLG